MTSTTARRFTAKGVATRTRIVEAAAALMYERGVAGTSIEDVRDAAGVSASQLYHYFDDKRSLTLAVIGFQIETVLGLQHALLAPVTSISQLRAWRESIVGLTARNAGAGGCPIGSLASELAESDPGARADLAIGFARWETELRAGLIRMRDAGELRADTDAETLALSTLAALQGGLLLTQVRREAAPLAAALDASLAHIMSFAV